MTDGFEHNPETANVAFNVMTMRGEAARKMEVSLRLPQNLGSSFPSDDALGAFHKEVLAERAASLGRAGKKLAAELANLRAEPSGLHKSGVVKAAADAAYHYFIQRELCGLFSHEAVIVDYDIPKEVLAQIGAK